MPKQAVMMPADKNESLENRVMLRPLAYMLCGSENRTADRWGDCVIAIRRLVQIAPALLPMTKCTKFAQTKAPIPAGPQLLSDRDIFPL